MRHMFWKRLTLAIASGSLLFQLPGCTEGAIYVTSLAAVVTAGSVVYLVIRVLD